MTELDAFLNLIEQLDELIALFEEHPDPVTQERAVALLSGLDALHREGLQRLAEALREVGGQALIDRLTADPVVEILFGLYDLVDLNLPEESRPDGPTAFVPLEQVTVLHQPRATWVEVARAADLPPGTLQAVAVDDIRVLLVNMDGEVYAYRNVCPGSNLSLEAGRLEGSELVCPWHNCRYDARTGRQRGGEGRRLEVFPVARREGSIQLAREPHPEDRNGHVDRHTEHE